MLKQKITINDVAKAAGVSISTVSRTLNSFQKSRARNETQMRVLAAAQQLNYVPNRLASGLKKNRSQTLGVTIPNILNPFFTAVVRSIQDFFTTRGYEILICNTDDSSAREDHAVKALLSRRIDGLILAKCSEDNSFYERLAAERFPLVLIDRDVPGLDCDTVVVDNSGVSERVMNKLLELGHRQIGIITPPPANIPPRIDRIEGCRSAMSAHGLKLASDLLVEVDFHKDSGAAVTAKLLSRRLPPTALFVLNTFLAAGAIAELETRKLRLPEQMSFVMFDDPEWATLLRPKVSVVRQPVHEIGYIAARLLMERINQPEKPFESVRLAAKFIERESIVICKR
jgi:LacI family transcriptional regulator, galactose operon repressor